MKSYCNQCYFILIFIHSNPNAMNLNERFLHFMTLVPLALLMACNGSDNNDDPGNIEADIIGSWRVNDVSILFDGVEYGEYIRQLSAEAGVPLTDEIVNDLREDAELELNQFIGQTIEFLADGSIRGTYSDYGTGEGNWSIAGNTLSLDSGDGPLLYTVENLTDDELRLSFSGDGTDPVVDVVEEGKLRVVLYFTRT